MTYSVMAFIMLLSSHALMLTVNIFSVPMIQYQWYYGHGHSESPAGWHDELRLDRGLSQSLSVMMACHFNCVACGRPTKVDLSGQAANMPMLLFRAEQLQRNP